MSKSSTFAVRAGLIYFILSMPLGPVSGLPGVLYPTFLLGAGVDYVVRLIFGLPEGPASQTSSDTASGWLAAVLFLGIAVVGAGLWTALAHRRGPSPEALHEGLRLYLRYTLFASMLLYGFAKVVLLQFPPHSEVQLHTPFGQLTPMGLLWRFMGHSPVYQVFGGIAEIVGALLLVTRRTTTAGALVVAGVMTNVVMMNYCFDVTVKLGSTTYLVMAVILLLPESRRLIDFLLLNRAVEPASLESRILPAWSPRTMLIVKVVFVLLSAGYSLADNLIYKIQDSARGNEPLEGTWKATPLPAPPADEEATDPATPQPTWRLVIVMDTGTLAARDEMGTWTYLRINRDKEPGTIRLESRRPEVRPLLLEPGDSPDRFLMKTTDDGKPAWQFTLERMEPTKHRLTDTPFHLVQ